MRALAALLATFLLVSSTAAQSSTLAASQVTLAGTAAAGRCNKPPEVLFVKYGTWNNCLLPAAVGYKCTLGCSKK